MTYGIYCRAGTDIKMETSIKYGGFDSISMDLCVIIIIIQQCPAVGRPIGHNELLSPDPSC